MSKRPSGVLFRGPWQAVVNGGLASDDTQPTEGWEEEGQYLSMLQLRALLRIFGGSVPQYVLEAGYFLCGELGYWDIIRGKIVPLGDFCEMSWLDAALNVGVQMGVFEVGRVKNVEMVCAVCPVPTWLRDEIVSIGSRSFWHWARNFDSYLLYYIAVYVFHVRYCKDVCPHQNVPLFCTLGIPRRWQWLQNCFGTHKKLQSVQ